MKPSWAKEPKVDFARLTAVAASAIGSARDESHRIKVEYIGTEQILVGLILQEKGIAAQALKLVGADVNKVRCEYEKITGTGSSIGVDPAFTPRAGRVLELAFVEDRRKRVGTAHILLAMVKEREGVAVRVFENMGVAIEQIRPITLRLLQETQEET
jgi:ATP-dependent Clp protease ATP-binding subunit ClpA